MAWIESHQELRHHPKLSAVCRTLSAKRSHMAGHLHFLWWWCMDYALDGDLTKYSKQQIADAAEWESDASTFVDALVSSGFIDVDKESMKIHDWIEFCGELILKRLDRRKAKRESLGKRTADNIRRTAENGRNISPTVPNHTVPNHTKDSFDAFWKIYPKKIGKDAAKKAWHKKNPPLEACFTALKAQVASPDWIKESGQFIPHPATWINQGRWQDEVKTEKKEVLI